MKYSLRTEHIKLTSQDKEKLEDCLNRLEKHVEPPFVTDVSIIQDTHHLKGNIIRCIIMIEHGKKVYRAERSEDTVQNAIDAVCAALKSELASDHDKRKQHS
ncbi:MAG: hypothetical protein A3E36_03250 [Candidatus Andersenbacteria bacterium RIFCSPHIGHO2_12_FULL_45_11b]|uniref:Ribosomal subunit interface protein n=1 Tax=Candidatus Andersenbacteria bacterium RIFCSPHIGHO2_12_FULL_45_11b TaxID=1797282 RepID=A0A1G1X9D6_9BACT|nr:MAG: hypothetical protein A3E36_03250 [Candidatus Andersenbacteria bacterium RIFCSPHIGHO2_12_FULL_45_11b]